MFEGDGQYQNSGSSIPLHLNRNNETVTSGLTNATWESAHTSLMNNPSSVYRRGGGGMGPKLSGITEGEEDNESIADSFHHQPSAGAPIYYQSSEASMRSSLNNNSLHGSSHGDGGGGGGASVISASSASYYLQQQQQQQRRSNRHASHLNSSLRNSDNASVISSAASTSRRRHHQYDSSTINSSSVINSSINSSQHQVIDNQRLISHNPKAATQEVNVSEYQEAILNGDETTSLPDEYYDDDSYTQFRRKHASDATFSTATGGNSSNQETDVEMLSTSPTMDTYKSPFSLRRRWYSLVSVLAAFSLAVVGLKISVDSLSTTTTSLLPQASNKISSSHASDYLPGYQFGGGLGGLTAGQERARRMDLAYNQYGIQLAPPQQQQQLRPNGREPVVGTSRGGLTRTARFNIQAPSDPFHGYGPPQFNAEFDSAPQQSIIQAGLSSVPLTAYIPPPTNHEERALFGNAVESLITM